MMNQMSVVRDIKNAAEESYLKLAAVEKTLADVNKSESETPSI